MTARTLPREEYGRLAETETRFAVDMAPGGIVVVIEDDAGAIVASWAAFPVVHVEGLWIAPGHRRTGGVGRRLLLAMGRAVRSVFGLSSAVTGAVTPEIEAFIERRGGVAIPGKSYLVPLPAPKGA